MAHVRIYRNEREDSPGLIHIEVDGVDLSAHVYDTPDFGLVKVGSDPVLASWGVRMVIAADSLDVDLPDAVVEAINRTEAEQAEAMGAES